MLHARSNRFFVCVYQIAHSNSLLQQCVKNKALLSVLMVRNVSREEGMAVIDRVFDRCYKDLEPFGRYPRRGSKDPEKALIDGVYYGYID